MKRPPYINEFRDRHGKRRVYFRRAGWTIALPTNIGSPEFNLAYSAALKKSEKQKSSRVIDRRTMEGVIVAYYQSADYKTLSDQTKRTYRIELEKIRREHGKKLIADLRRRHVQQIMDALSDRPVQANKALRFIGLIARFALRRDLIESDPTAGVKCLPTKSEGFRDWPEKLIGRFEDHRPIGTVARLAFDLAVHTGQCTLGNAAPISSE